MELKLSGSTPFSIPKLFRFWDRYYFLAIAEKFLKYFLNRKGFYTFIIYNGLGVGQKERAAWASQTAGWVLPAFLWSAVMPQQDNWRYRFVLQQN